MFSLIFTHAGDQEAREYVWNGKSFVRKSDATDGQTFKSEEEAQKELKAATAWKDKNARGTIEIKQS